MNGSEFNLIGQFAKFSSRSLLDFGEPTQYSDTESSHFRPNFHLNNSLGIDAIQTLTGIFMYSQTKNFLYSCDAYGTV